jgi:hypothetical protein
LPPVGMTSACKLLAPTEGREAPAPRPEGGVGSRRAGAGALETKGAHIEIAQGVTTRRISCRTTSASAPPRGGHRSLIGVAHALVDCARVQSVGMTNWPGTDPPRCFRQRIGSSLMRDGDGEDKAVEPLSPVLSRRNSRPYLPPTRSCDRRIVQNFSVIGHGCS